MIDGPVDPLTGIPLAANGGAGVPPVDSDGDGDADFLDTDSDNDGLDDSVESGLTLTGSDNDSDGIDDGVNASYSDPDGIVNNSPLRLGCRTLPISQLMIGRYGLR